LTSLMRGWACLARNKKLLDRTLRVPFKVQCSRFKVWNPVCAIH
jgi:hypothetical protein